MAEAARVRRMEYEPRDAQREIHLKLQRFNSIVAHRRLGKTVLAVNQLISSAARNTRPKPRYAYVAPYRKQAKDVAWDFLKDYSEPFRDSDPNIAELWVELFNGAKITLHGSDNPNALRGIYLDGVVLDEFGDMDPTVWTQVLRPTLADRKGWAIFIGTPKGQNAFYDIHQNAVNDPDWFAGMYRASDTGIIDESELAANRKMMTPEEYAQEFECSFQAPNVGAYYGKEMQFAEDEKRITRVPWEPSIPVTTAWDLGVDDATAIWFAQMVGHEVRVIDYYEASGEGLAHYANELRSKRYVYGEHILPHDAAVKELGTGLSRLEVLRSLGLNANDPPPAQRVEDGINAVRMMLPKCYFDKEKCARGIKALQSYRREWAQKLGTWRPTPLHDWASHGADAFRYLAMGLRPHQKSTKLVYSNKGIV